MVQEQTPVGIQTQQSRGWHVVSTVDELSLVVQIRHKPLEYSTIKDDRSQCSRIS